MRFLPSVLVAALTLTSCLEIEQTVTLRADGSGTQAMKLTMTERSLAAARSRSAIDATALSDPTKIFDARLVRSELTDAGLVCDKISTSAQRRSRTLEVDAEFPGLSALRNSPLSGSGAEWEFAAGKRAGTTVLSFYPRGKAAWKSAREKVAKMPADPSDRENEYFAHAKKQMRGLEIRWTLDLPGDVISHSKNLTKPSDRRVSITIDESDIENARDLVLQLAPRFQVVFDSRQCTFTAD